MNTNVEKFILTILKRGDSIRRIDGRWQCDFVDIDTLEQLIKDGRAEVYQLQGMDFVRQSPKSPKP